MSASTKVMANRMGSERLAKLLNEADDDGKPLPMVSLPETDGYWCEGWKSAANTSELSVVPPLASSSSSSSSSNSSSPSPSPSTQSSASTSSITNNNNNNNNNKTGDLNKSSPNRHNHHSITVSTFDFDTISEHTYQESFMGKDQLIFYGQDESNAPLVLSYKIEQQHGEFGEQLRAILRTRETNYCMSTPKSNIQDPVTPQKICKQILPDLRVKFLSPLTIVNVSLSNSIQLSFFFIIDLFIFVLQKKKKKNMAQS